MTRKERRATALKELRRTNPYYDNPELVALWEKFEPLDGHNFSRQCFAAWEYVFQHGVKYERDRNAAALKEIRDTHTKWVIEHNQKYHCSPKESNKP